MMGDEEPPGTRALTRLQFYEELVDETLRDVAEMELGFMAWCARHAPRWRSFGLDERWIRQRIEAARDAVTLCRGLRAAGRTPGQVRKRARMHFEAVEVAGVDLYHLVLARLGEREPPTWGTTEDLMQRYTLRVLLAQTEERVEAAFTTWAGRPATPGVGADDLCLIQDLSGVEELQWHLGMAQRKLELLTAVPPLSFDELLARVDGWATAARALFIARYGFAPEAAATAFTPVTVDGLVDHDDYYAALRAQEV